MKISFYFFFLLCIKDEDVSVGVGGVASGYNLSLFAQSCKCSSALEVFHAYMAVSGSLRER